MDLKYGFRLTKKIQFATPLLCGNGTKRLKNFKNGRGGLRTAKRIANRNSGHLEGRISPNDQLNNDFSFPVTSD
jgi:hypothetical protein